MAENTSMPMKNVVPSPAHVAYRRALEAAMAEHGSTLDAADLLAITSNLVGQLVALQDQRVMTPAMAMEVVSRNMECGNRQVIENLLHTTGGSA